MVRRVEGFESAPVSQYTVTDILPPAGVRALDVLMEKIIGVDQLEFVEKEGFPGLPRAVNDLVGSAAPRCGEGCGLVVRLDGTQGGVADDATLSLVCPLIRESTEAAALEKESRCNQQHRRVVERLGGWAGGLVGSILEAEQQRADAERQAEAANDRVWNLLH